MDNTLFWFLLCGYMVLLVCGIILYAMIQDTFKYAKIAHERIDIVLQCLDLMAKHADKQEEEQHAAANSKKR